MNNWHQSLQKLVEGNQRFMEGKMLFPNLDIARRKEVIDGQSPFAVVLSCADSRVPPELIFDAGIGDLFTLRNAGNLLDSSVIGSIEYAVEHLKTPLIVVLGHEDCGAVKAALSLNSAPGNINEIIKKIKASIESNNIALIDAIKINIQKVVECLKKTNPIISEAFEQGQTNIVPAYYSLSSGKVEFLD